MMKKFLIVASLMFFSLICYLPITVSAQPTVNQQKTEEELCKAAGNTYSNGVCTAPGKELTGSPSSFLNTFTNLMLYIAGAVAVIVIIIGGIRYITSTGDAMRIKQAKDTILYGIVGLIIAIIAWALVNFIVRQLT